MSVDAGAIDADISFLVSRVPAYKVPSSRRIVGGVYDFRAYRDQSEIEVKSFPHSLAVSLSY